VPRRWNLILCGIIGGLLAAPFGLIDWLRDSGRHARQTNLRDARPR
jgi:hypothetical protein